MGSSRIVASYERPKSFSDALRDSRSLSTSRAGCATEAGIPAGNACSAGPVAAAFTAFVTDAGMVCHGGPAPLIAVAAARSCPSRVRAAVTNGASWSSAVGADVVVTGSVVPTGAPVVVAPWPARIVVGGRAPTERPSEDSQPTRTTANTTPTAANTDRDPISPFVALPHAHTQCRKTLGPAGAGARS